jgi:hypothetical protein
VVEDGGELSGDVATLAAAKPVPVAPAKAGAQTATAGVTPATASA